MAVATPEKPKTKAKAQTAGGLKGKVTLKGKDGKDRNAKALAMREKGKSFVEIATAIGWANPGIAWNAVARGRQERDGVAIPTISKRSASRKVNR